MDTFVLTGPQGSSMNVASFVTEPGPDFGESDLLKAIYSENPAAEGGVLAAEYVNVRRMAFPLRIASVGAFGGAAGVAAWLRTLARPGATLDVLLDGVPTAEAIRFDVNAGRYEVGAWDTKMWSQSDRMEGALKLDVQPFGYWPTMILLASAASVGGPGILTISKGSIMGDVPGLAELFIAPTSATTFGPGTMKTDAVFWSLSARASFQSFWPAASGLALGSFANEAATLVGDGFAPGSQSIRYFLASSGAAAGNPFFFGNNAFGDFWQAMSVFVIPPALAPAYQGRFRGYAWAKLGPSQTYPLQVTLDAAGPTGFSPPAIGSAAPIATLSPAVASNTAAAASPAYSMLDLGEMTLSPLSSSMPGETQIRLWMRGATTNPGLPATGILDIGGLYLQPLDGPAGVLPAGLAQPTYTAISRGYGRLSLPVTGEALITTPTSVVGSVAALAPAVLYRGQLPARVGASTIQFDLNLAGKRSDAPTWMPLLRGDNHFAQVSILYRPRFAFLKGI